MVFPYNRIRFIKGGAAVEKTIRVGLFGVGRGISLSKYCKQAQNAKLVAVCDKWQDGLERAQAQIEDETVTYYTDFDAFIQHDMDAVYLANYAVEHAPFAIAAMKAGKDVISEVLPVQTMAQAAELIECVETTGRKYFYAENFCHMNGPAQMRKMYQNGELGEFEYGEGEYMHNCEPIWPRITRGEPDHWRNTMSAFFYCTHSVGPLLHITGLRPQKVVGVEGMFNPRMARMGAKAGHMAVELITLENGALLKSVHGIGPSKDSIWYSVYGSKGRLETAREDAENGGVNTLYVNLDQQEGVSEKQVVRTQPETEISKLGAGHGHFGSDYVCFWNAFEYLAGNPDADAVTVYEAIDMWMVGFFGYLSVLKGGIPQKIPDMRNAHTREQYRNDCRCTDVKIAGDQLIPSYSKGTIQVDPKIYEATRNAWLKQLRGN